MQRRITNPKKFIFANFSVIEQRVLLWMLARRYRIFIFVSVIILLLILPTLPYLNLFIDKNLIIFLIFLSFIVIFSPETKLILSIVSVFLVLSMIFYLVEETDAAELLGNYVYGFLFAGTVLYTLKLFKNQHK